MPDARERLEHAALELFAEHGYEKVSVAQISARAGLNRATFFRHFADKREVLFSGEDVLADVFSQAIRAASAQVGAIGCLRAAFEATAAGVMVAERHALAVRRSGVVLANDELRERELLKISRLTQVTAGALAERDGDALSARVFAELGILAFTLASEQWLAADGEQPFLPIVMAMLDDVQVHAGHFATY